jgi:hypothetical protein
VAKERKEGRKEGERERRERRKERAPAGTRAWYVRLVLCSDRALYLINFLPRRRKGRAACTNPRFSTNKIDEEPTNFCALIYFLLYLTRPRVI